jgi:hypothetical protein
MPPLAKSFALAMALSSLPLIAKSPEPRAVVECQSAGKATVRLTVENITYVVRVDCGVSV